VLHANLSFTELEFWAMEVYIVVIGIFPGIFGSHDLDPDLTTFIYELDPYCWEIHPMHKYELPTSRQSKVIV